jgi:membrane protease YdiL (CAAX protease family)
MGAIVRVAPYAIILLVIALRVQQGKISKADLGWQRPRSFGIAVGWWLFFLAIAAGFELLLYSYGELELGGFRHTGLPAVLFIVGMVLLAPVAEELLFRGIFLKWLVKKLSNPHVAIVIQAVVFVAVHNFAYQASFASNVGVAQSFVDACVFAYARIHTNSIFTAIAMHITGNAVAVAEMLA